MLVEVECQAVANMLHAQMWVVCSRMGHREGKEKAKVQKKWEIWIWQERAQKNATRMNFVP